MEIKVVAVEKTEKSTISRLLIDGQFECYTLEDVDRGLKQSMSEAQIAELKVQNETAIPEGTYNVEITFSPHFGKNMPLLDNVPGYEGVRIHSGNFPSDTEGCLLVANGWQLDEVTDSRSAFNVLFPKLQAALAAGEKITLSIDRTISG